MNAIQASGNLYGEWITLQRISKQEAKKLFENGTQIYLQGCKYHPFGVYQPVCPIIYDPQEADNTVNQFDYLTNSYKWYNCDSERGYYINYFKKI